MKNENKYQSELKKKIEDRIPGSIVMKNDPSFRQGFPDLTVFGENNYAVLEVKRSANEPHRPNQDWYIQHFKEKGRYASFIFPENEEEVLNELERAL